MSSVYFVVTLLRIWISVISCDDCYRSLCFELFSSISSGYLEQYFSSILVTFGWDD